MGKIADSLTYVIWLVNRRCS